MPELGFKGKEFVRNHHLSVPHRPIEPDVEKSVGKPRLDGNLIIHGDNLHALKSLLPMYAGKVNCIYIDPPYNTGNESWCYNDNVNSPQMQAWLDQNPVGIEDGLRHDKWCAMMWPRLVLLRELLAEDGVIFISIDDNEQHRLRMMMDEIWGGHFLGLVSVVNNLKGRSDDAHVATANDFVLVYAKDSEQFTMRGKPLSDEQAAEYDKEDQWGSYKEIGFRKTGKNWERRHRPNLFYPVYFNPLTCDISLEKGSGNLVELCPLDAKGREGRWRWSAQRFQDNIDDIVVRKLSTGGENYAVFTKMRLNDASGNVRSLLPKSIWIGSEYDSAKGDKLVKSILPETTFVNAKPLATIMDVLLYGTANTDSLVLDSFAGSGTTAHATLALNKKDDGNRKFILVECEDYADSITAERVRCVIKGVPGAKDKDLKKGLGGKFTYCTLGEATDMDKLLTGERLPSFDALGTLLFHTATNETVDPSKLDKPEGFLGTSSGYHVWLIYKPDLDFLKSNEAALTLDGAKKIAKSKRDKKRHLVFAPATFVSKKTLEEANNGKGIPVDYQPLPWSLYRVAGS